MPHEFEERPHVERDHPHGTDGVIALAQVFHPEQITPAHHIHFSRITGIEPFLLKDFSPFGRSFMVLLHGVSLGVVELFGKHEKRRRE